MATPVLPAAPSGPLLKRKVAVGRFSNATNYGRAILFDGEKDPLADQASDMLMARLTESGKFMVFERKDLDAIKDERRLQGRAPSPLIGVDALIIGSVTEFGRKTEGQAGFLSSTKRQTATATVEIRMVDVQTGQAFFSTKGNGTASVETGEVAGFGNRAGYDSTLNDSAISSAISDLINNTVQKLEERPWHTDILDTDGDRVRISGGQNQGLKAGDQFRVERPGKTIVSQQTGLPITLPGEEVARIRVMSFFGQGEAEGSTASVISGRIPPDQIAELTVTEIH